MARVPQEEIERLKAEISVQRLAEARGISLSTHGSNLIGLCPFHDDHEPSLVITPEKNLWNCLGACGSGGTVIDWVMKSEGVSFRHAVEILRTGAIPQTSPSTKPPKIGTIPKLPPPVSFDAEDRELMRQVVDYYHQTLKESPEALSYLEKRGLKNSEMIEHFKIGYANRTLGLRLPNKNRQAGAVVRERLQKLGLYRDTGREHFNGSIVFPIFDEHGHVSEIYGRKTCHNLTPGLAYHLYLPGPHKGVFNAPALSSSKDVILCEAIIDALTFWCAGFRNVTSSYGVNGFTPDHLDAFKKASIERVFIAYDRDPAGDKAAAALSEKLIGEGLEVFRIQFPRGMDANAYALKIQPPEKSFDLVIRNAQWVGRPASPSIEASTAEPQEPAAKKEDLAVPASVSVPLPAPACLKASEEPANISFLVAEKPIDSPSPAPAQAAPETEIRNEEIIIRVDDRRWRIRGLSKNMSYDQIKVNLLVSRGEAFHVDTLDLYSARSRALFLKQASDELRIKEDVLRGDLGKVLLKLEELQDTQIKDALEPKEKVVVISEKERAEALELLKDPKLIERILSDFERCGIVGEETNKLTGYLSAVSRKLEKPLAIIIQSSSSAGKTSLMEAVLAFVPDEERVKYSAMTGQSLFYMGETNLKHKILAIVEEEGAERASYALKLLQSEGELSIASTGKDPATGKLVTHEYRVEGPVMIFVTTTSIDIDEELQNRCIILTVNESREQTRAIHRLQREMETLEGLVSLRERDWTYRLHRNAQRLLEPLLVANPFARHLTFLDDTTRTRRDHSKYLTMIRAIALLHQHQRPRKSTMVRGKAEPFIEVQLDDIELANTLANEVLGRTLDEMLPQTRRFLDMLYAMVTKRCKDEGIEQADYRFQRREVCEYTGWSLTQVRHHLERLVEMEYVLVHRGFRGQCFVYELLYNGEGRDGKPFVLGLLEIQRLREKLSAPNYDEKVAGFLSGVTESTPEVAWVKRGQNAPLSVANRGGSPQPEQGSDADLQEDATKKLKNSQFPPKDQKTQSYPNVRRNPLSSLVAKEKTPGGNGSEATVAEKV